MRFKKADKIIITLVIVAAILMITANVAVLFI